MVWTRGPVHLEAVIVFLLQAVVISLSGVMAPGPMTAAALAAGTRSRHAGVRIALGHGVVEFPLMILIMAGTGALLASEQVRIGIGLAGGAVLVFMGAQMLHGLRREADSPSQHAGKSPVWTGILLSGGNPYFLFWWATVGLTLTSRASELGALAFGLFAITHWLCDLVWLEALSLASFKGSKLLGGRNQQVVLAICALALLIFGAMFIHDAVRRALAG